MVFRSVLVEGAKGARPDMEGHPLDRKDGVDLFPNQGWLA
jgi:hypothetical protein